MIKTKINNFLYKIRNLEPTTPEGTIRILIGALIFIVIIGLIVGQIKADTEIRKMTIEQKANIEQISKELELQREIRIEIQEKTTELQESITKVKNLEKLNSHIRNEMLKEANKF